MRHLVVVGNGMAGMACLDEILKRKPDFRITVFSEEAYYNYNRILLSSVLAGEKSMEEITINTEEWYRKNDITLHLGTKVVGVDAKNKIIETDKGIVRLLPVVERAKQLFGEEGVCTSVRAGRVGGPSR